MREEFWMVRAGWGGAFVEDFVDGSFVSIGFPNAGEVHRLSIKRTHRNYRDRRCKKHSLWPYCPI